MFRLIRPIAGLVCAAALLTGCSSSTSTSPGGTSGSSPTSRTSAGSGITVDVTITGDHTATLEGTKGQCSTSTANTLSIVLSGSDYPDLGPNGAFSLMGEQTFSNGNVVPPNFKLIIGNAGFLSGLDSGMVVSSDNKTVTLDSDVVGRTAGAVMHIHIMGMIICG
jgi:hypothetical protein